EEPNGQHAGQCLGQEDAERVEAKNLGAGRLQPETHRGFVDRDEAPWIIGDKKEIVPVVQHASDGGRIIGPEAVLAQRIEVHDDRDEQDAAEGEVMPGEPALLSRLRYRLLSLIWRSRE